MSNSEEPNRPGIEPGGPATTTPEAAPGAKRQRAKRAPSASAKAVAVSAENSSRGVGSATTFLLAALSVIFWLPMISLGLLLLVGILGGCEFVYLSKCGYDCTAAGGADAYGRPQ